MNLRKDLIESNRVKWRQRVRERNVYTLHFCYLLRVIFTTTASENGQANDNNTVGESTPGEPGKKK